MNGINDIANIKKVFSLFASIKVCILWREVVAANGLIHRSIALKNTSDTGTQSRQFKVHQKHTEINSALVIYGGDMQIGSQFTGPADDAQYSNGKFRLFRNHLENPQNRRIAAATFAPPPTAEMDTGNEDAASHATPA